jgi:hypothetical protein
MQMHHPQTLPVISAIVALVLNFLASTYAYSRLLRPLDDGGARDTGMIFGVLGSMAFGTFGGYVFATGLGFWPGLVIGGSAWALLAALAKLLVDLWAILTALSWLTDRLFTAFCGLLNVLMSAKATGSSATADGAPTDTNLPGQELMRGRYQHRCGDAVESRVYERRN